MRDFARDGTREFKSAQKFPVQLDDAAVSQNENFAVRRFHRVGCVRVSELYYERVERNVRRLQARERKKER